MPDPSVRHPLAGRPDALDRAGNDVADGLAGQRFIDRDLFAEILPLGELQGQPQEDVHQPRPGSFMAASFMAAETCSSSSRESWSSTASAA